MSEASFASLGPTLLARKGGAKPAMRPQLAPLPGVVAPEAEQLEDLGWNDMGQNDTGQNDTGQEDSAGATIVSIKPAANEQLADEDEAHEPLVTDSPLVHRQQRRLAERILAEDEEAPAQAPVRKAPKSTVKKTAAKAAKSARRAAFTLRLDTERHLKLRLAATMQGMSAQALVTEALDAMLADIDGLEALAERMNGKLKHS